MLRTISLALMIKSHSGNNVNNSYRLARGEDFNPRNEEPVKIFPLWDF